MPAKWFALIALAASAAHAQPDNKSRVDAIFSRFNRTDSPGCAVGPPSRREPVLTAAYGMADLEHESDSLPRASSSPAPSPSSSPPPPFCCSRNRASSRWTTPSASTFPNFPTAYAAITIRHMLNHTSGIRDWGSVEAIAGWPRTTRANTHAHVLDILSRQRALNYPAGADYSYTNSGYNLAAILVGRVAGKSLADFTRESISRRSV